MAASTTGLGSGAGGGWREGDRARRVDRGGLSIVFIAFGQGAAPSGLCRAVSCPASRQLGEALTKDLFSKEASPVTTLAYEPQPRSLARRAMASAGLR